MIKKINLLSAVKLAERNNTPIEVARLEGQEDKLSEYTTVFPNGTYTKTLLLDVPKITSRKSIYELDLRSQDWVLI
ncbi:hypothetical protein [Proteus phage 2]|nr:hypothetical protein [Proteus phage 2]